LQSKLKLPQAVEKLGSTPATNFATKKPMHLRVICFAAALAVFLPQPAVRAAEETCAGCERTIMVTGEFRHSPVNDAVEISGMNARESAQYREEIYGPQFTLTIPNLAPGQYTLRLGFAETWYTNAGARLFDVTCGDKVIATNFDLFAAAGWAKVHRLTTTVEHPGDALAGPLTVSFRARKGEAKLNTLDLRDTNKTTLVSLVDGDLVASDDPVLTRIPVVAGPELWRSPAQPRAARVKDLLQRLAPTEKIAQMRNATAAIPRLGIPAYDYWNECLHGVGRAGIATVFPQAIGLAATWDEPLFHEIGDTIATEARAKHNDYAARHNGNSARYYGLTFWTPNINLYRDPRWGRGQETYGEDPFLTTRLGVAFIQGLQGNDPNHLKAMACAKHFAVHSGPESDRHTFNVSPAERDLYETYLPQFEAAVREGRVGAVMGAYNRLSNEPACSNPFLLQTLLRERWGFTGHVVSDCGAITDIYANHKTVRTADEAAARAVKAGCDLCCGTDYKALARALKAGLISEAEIDGALGRLFDARFQLGLFDPTNVVPFAQIGLAQNDTPEHSALALRAARESLVLLKNNGLLPLDRSKIKRIAVIGANADSVPMLLGNYNGTPSQPVTILDGIKSVAGPNIEVVTVTNYPLALPRDQKGFRPTGELADAVAATKSVDVVIYAGGIHAKLEGEEMKVNYEGFIGGDRTRIELPQVQTELLQALHATGKPVVFVNCSGSAMAMPWEAENLPAIVQAWYPGQAGGRAVAELLFGDFNPAGRLPVTFYRSTDDLPPFEDYSMTNRTYRYFTGPPQFAFGHGLSYTQYKYSNAKLEQNKVSADGKLKLLLEVKNVGARDGDEVVQVYFRHVNSAVPQARQALCAFRRVNIPAGRRAQIEIEIPVSRVRYWDVNKKQYVVEPGMYQLLIGGASDNLPLRLPVRVR
jgi:beta-glucosidase